METTVFIIIIIASLVLIALIALVILFFLQLKKPDDRAKLDEVRSDLQTISQIVQQGQTQIAVLSEKVAHLEPVTQNIAVLSEKVTHLEPVTQSISATLTNELAKVRENLASLQEHARARQELERQTIDSVKRLELIIAGTQSKGAAGENIVELVFAKLPVEWQIRNFTVKGRAVEFGLRLPNNLILPIDSKWPATTLIEQIARTESFEKREILKKEIEKEIVRKAKEVSKYIEPGITMPFAIAVIPDAVYELSAAVQGEAFESNVVLVSYSMFVPYLFLTIQTTLKTLQTIDLQKLDAYLDTIKNSINKLQEELDGRFAKALIMLNNSRDDMRAHISNVSGSITNLQISAPMSSTSLPESID